MICDSHFHVFGPAERYPHAGGLGVQKYVFVQPSSYGRDNACMLDAMREIGPAKCRGIVDIDEDASDAALERLHAAGVRGVRVNVNPIKPDARCVAGCSRPDG